VMEAGSAPESALLPNAASAVVSKKKTLAEIKINLWEESCIGLAFEVSIIIHRRGPDCLRLPLPASIQDCQHGLVNPDLSSYRRRYGSNVKISAPASGGTAEFSRAWQSPLFSSKQATNFGECFELLAKSSERTDNCTPSS
jgi:hypothetical protein